MKKFVYIILALLAGGALTAFFYRGELRVIAAAKLRERGLPKAQSADAFGIQNTNSLPTGDLPEADKNQVEAMHEESAKHQSAEGGQTSAPPGEPISNLLLKKPLYPEINLKVPFTSQAPYRQWVMPYKEFCEEASVVMVDGFFKGKTKFTRDEADAVLKKAQQWETERFGYWEDTNAEETATVLREYFGYEGVRLIENPTVETLKRELSAGHPVIVPAAGRQLGNPYYTPPGPLYHMLVIKGYTSKEFIVNDPGVNRGEHFTYSFATIMDAMHDWNAGDVEHGRKVVIAVAP